MTTVPHHYKLALVSFIFIIISSVFTFIDPSMIFVTISFVVLFLFQYFFIIRNEFSKNRDKIKISDFDDDIKALYDTSDSLKERIEAIEKELLLLKTLSNNRESFGVTSL